MSYAPREEDIQRLLAGNEGVWGDAVLDKALVEEGPHDLGRVLVDILQTRPALEALDDAPIAGDRCGRVAQHETGVGAVVLTQGVDVHEVMASD
jgi:hypothetical protein